MAKKKRPPKGNLKREMERRKQQREERMAGFHNYDDIRSTIGNLAKMFLTMSFEYKKIKAAYDDLIKRGEQHAYTYKFPNEEEGFNFPEFLESIQTAHDEVAKTLGSAFDDSPWEEKMLVFLGVYEPMSTFQVDFLHFTSLVSDMASQLKVHIEPTLALPKDVDELLEFDDEDCEADGCVDMDVLDDDDYLEEHDALVGDITEKETPTD